MDSNYQAIDDDISRAAFDLLLNEPFYAHVLAGMPRVITKEVKSIGLHWDGQAVLRVNPEWFRKELTAKQRGVVLKHEILHVVFLHLLRPVDLDPAIYSIAADLVVNQLLLPLRPMRGWPVLGMFPEMKFEPDQSAEIYYTALATLFRTMQQAGFDGGAQGNSGAQGNGGGGGGGGELSDSPKSRAVGKRGKESGPNTTGAPPDWIQSTKMPESAKALAALLADRDNESDDSGWFDGKDALGLAAGQYAVGGLLLRARDRVAPHQWGSLPSALLSHLDLIAAERRPKLDWKRMVRVFCASSGRTCIKHTVKRVSKRYGTRPGIKVQRLQRLLVAVDTSGSINQNMLDVFFTEIHAVWRSGASVHVVECDAAVGRDYRYTGKTPSEVSGGGGTDFDPVFRWMQKQRPFDGCIFLTDGFGNPPTTPPRCRLLWIVTGANDIDPEGLPFGTSVRLPIT